MQFHMTQDLRIVRGPKRMHAKCYGDKQTMAELKMVMTKNVLRHKERGHAAGDHEPREYAGLRCRQGPHRTFSPRVSCTALASAARLALPLAWAICRYMDV